MGMEHIHKSSFCERELTQLLKVSDSDVNNARYEEACGEEYVIINFKNGFSRRVCVTGDSLSALTRDVLIALN